MLGLATAGATFNSAVTGCIWELPRNLLITDGPVTPEWIAAEAIKSLCENFDFPFGVKRPNMISQSDLQQIGVDWRMHDTAMTNSRPDFRVRYIDPCMTQFARELQDRKARIFLPMQHFPQTEMLMRLVTHRESGLNLRYLQAWDFGTAGYENDDGEWVESIREPSLISRFDVLFAA